MENDKLNQIQTTFNDIINDRPMMVVKQTNYYSNHGKHKRYGSFIFDKLEHKLLCKKDGYYLLILFSNRYLISIKMVKAKAITYQKRVSWRKLVELPKSFNNLEGYINGK